MANGAMPESGSFSMTICVLPSSRSSIRGASFGEEVRPEQDQVEHIEVVLYCLDPGGGRSNLCRVIGRLPIGGVEVFRQNLQGTTSCRNA